MELCCAVEGASATTQKSLKDGTAGTYVRTRSRLLLHPLPRVSISWPSRRRLRIDSNGDEELAEPGGLGAGEPRQRQQAHAGKVRVGLLDQGQQLREGDLDVQHGLPGMCISSAGAARCPTLLHSALRGKLHGAYDFLEAEVLTVIYDSLLPVCGRCR